MTYYCRLLKAVEEFIAEEKTDAVAKENSATIGRAFSALNEMTLTSKITLLHSSQKEFDGSYFGYLNQVAKRLKDAKEVIEGTRLKLGTAELKSVPGGGGLRGHPGEKAGAAVGAGDGRDSPAGPDG